MKEKYYLLLCIGSIGVFLIRRLVVKISKWYDDLFHALFIAYLFVLLDIIIFPIELTDIGFKPMEVNWVPFQYIHNHWNNIRTIYVDSQWLQIIEMTKLIGAYVCLLLPLGAYLTWTMRASGHLVNLFMGIFSSGMIIGIQWLLNAYGLIDIQVIEIDHMVLQIIGYFIGAFVVTLLKQAKKGNKPQDAIYYEVKVKYTS